MEKELSTHDNDGTSLSPAADSRQSNPTAAENTGYLFIRDEKEYAKIFLSDIRYISGDAEYLSLHVRGRSKPYREKSSFASIRQLLSDSFVQIHRSSIINMDHVSRVGRGYVLMDDGAKIRISDGRKDEFGSMVDSRTVGKNRP